ncbi:MAG: cytidine deaminase [Eubacteriales bacterium]|nr:cytidine deaminase [Eubacteriales bacterium]MDD3881138.1 cytidine deaminase [Eubacteriales bacterium]MDD4511520.1 cytidine deaminase [Eubacteriales bacterium]
MSNEWDKLFSAARGVIKPRKVSDSMEVGSVGAAMLTKSGSIYTGICIDTGSSLGMCAERNALSSMLTNGEYEVTKVCAVYQDGTVMPPCGACREFMMQLGGDVKNTEVLVNNQGKTVKLCELMPEYPYN